MTVPSDFSVRALLAKPADAVLIRAMLTEVVRRQAACMAELTLTAARMDEVEDRLARARVFMIRAHERGSLSRARLDELLTHVGLVPYDDRRRVALTLTCEVHISHLRERDLAEALADAVEIRFDHPHVLVDVSSVRLAATPCLTGAAA